MLCNLKLVFDGRFYLKERINIPVLFTKEEYIQNTIEKVIYSEIKTKDKTLFLFSFSDGTYAYYNEKTNKTYYYKSYVEVLKSEPDDDFIMLFETDAKSGMTYQSIIDKSLNTFVNINECENLNQRQFTAEQRKKLAKEGKALPDGSYPIINKKDLENAIHTYGLGKNHAKAKSHIKKRAHALGAKDLIPENW